MSNPPSAVIPCLLCTSICYILPVSALQWLTIPHGSSNVVRTQLSHRWGWRGAARKWRHRPPLQCSIKQIDDRVHRQITRRIVHRAVCAPCTCAVVTTLKLPLLPRLSMGKMWQIPVRTVCLLTLKRSVIAAHFFMFVRRVWVLMFFRWCIIV